MNIEEMLDQEKPFSVVVEVTLNGYGKPQNAVDMIKTLRRIVELNFGPNHDIRLVDMRPNKELRTPPGGVGV